MQLKHQGSALLEVIITMVILAIGLFGLAGLQARVIQVEQESYQRGQALVLVNDIVERINANRGGAADYPSATWPAAPIPVGTGDARNLATACPASGAARDLCEWSALLKGASVASMGNPFGNMGNARGCITQIQALDATPGVCQPGIYQIEVVWQGKSDLFAPPASIKCGTNLYGKETFRRAITTRVSVGTPTCD